MSIRGRGLGERRGLAAPAMQEDTALREQAEPGLQEEKRGALLSFAHVPSKGHEKQLPPFVFFLSFFGPLCNIISTASAASEEGGLLLLDAKYCHRMRRKNRLKVQYYRYFLISRFIQDTEPFMMSHTHVLALIFWEVE